MRRLALLALTFLLALCSCRSANATLVAKLSATAGYHLAAYEHRCQHTDGHFPPECKPCEAIINEAVWQAKVALVNRDQGYLPPKEIAEIKGLIVELEKCP